MDVTTIQTLIGSLGFPIVCCGVLAYLIYYLIKTHAAEQVKFTEAIDNNTKVINEMMSILKGIKDDIDDLENTGGSNG